MSLIVSLSISSSLFVVYPRLGLTNSYHCDSWYYSGWGLSPHILFQNLDSLNSTHSGYNTRYPLYIFGWILRSLVPENVFLNISGSLFSKVILFILLNIATFLLFLSHYHNRISKFTLLIFLSILMNPFTMSQISNSYAQVSFILVYLFFLFYVTRFKNSFIKHTILYFLGFLALFANFGNAVIILPFLLLLFFISMHKRGNKFIDNTKVNVKSEIKLIGLPLIITLTPLIYLFSNQNLENNFFKFVIGQINYAKNIFSGQEWGSVILGGENKLFDSYTNQYLNNTLFVTSVYLIFLSFGLIFFFKNNPTFNINLMYRSSLYIAVVTILVSLVFECLNIGNTISFGHDGVILLPVFGIIISEICKDYNFIHKPSSISLNILIIFLILFAYFIFLTNIDSKMDASYYSMKLIYNLVTPLIIILCQLVFLAKKNIRMFFTSFLLLIAVQSSNADYGQAFYSNFDFFRANETTVFFKNQYDIAKDAVMFYEKISKSKNPSGLIITDGLVEDDLLILRSASRSILQCSQHNVEKSIQDLNKEKASGFSMPELIFMHNSNLAYFYDLNINRIIGINKMRFNDNLFLMVVTQNNV